MTGGQIVQNEAPTDFDLSAATAIEGAADGTVIGTLGAVVDANAGDSHGFTLIDDTGGRFAIVGDELRVADGTLLDFEAATSHDVTVRVTDSGIPALGYDPYSEAPNITRVVLDRTGPNAPLQVSVSADPDDSFSSDHNFDDFFL